MSNTVFIIGHRNPDTDSICSAIGYAALKVRLGINAEARRLGDINRETEFVLNYFNIKVPELLDNVKTQISDLNIDIVSPISPDISIKTAWNRMKKNNTKTLPVVDDDSKLIGIITLSDLTGKYMDVLGSNYIASENTSLFHIVETINASIVQGKNYEYNTTGRIIIATDDPDTVCSYVAEGDIVITGNRTDVMLMAIECGAKLIVMTNGFKPDNTVLQKAEEKSCILLSTPLDAFSVARLINQSVPISTIMTTEKLITFNIDDFVDDIKEKMLKTRYRSYPVIDNEGKIRGFVSRYHLISHRKKRVILLDHNEKNQTVRGIEDAEILEIIDHHKLGDIQTASPIFFKNEPVGSTASIIAGMYFDAGLTPASNIAGILCAAIISDTVKFQSPTCTYTDRRIAEKLADIAGIDIDEFSVLMFKAASEIEGKSPEEIFHQDLKIYEIKNLKVAISQVTVMGKEAYEEALKSIINYVNSSPELLMYDIVITAFIDVMRNTTRVFIAGSKKQLGLRAFSVPEGENTAVIPSILSRKKQILPLLMTEIDREYI